MGKIGLQGRFSRETWSFYSNFLSEKRVSLKSHHLYIKFGFLYFIFPIPKVQTGQKKLQNFFHSEKSFKNTYLALG